MARSIICPNVNSNEFKNLLSRIGDESLAYFIWNESNGNISENGLPYLSEFASLSDNTKAIILKSLSEDELDAAILNINNIDVSAKLGEQQSEEYDFSDNIKTSDGKLISIIEKRAFCDKATLITADALTSAKIYSRDDIWANTKSYFEENKALSEMLYSKLHALPKRSKNDYLTMEMLESRIESYNKILDPTAFEKLKEYTVNMLDLNGIRFFSKKKNKLRQKEMSNTAIDEQETTTQDATTGDEVEMSFEKEDFVGRDIRDYSTAAVKAMMMGLVKEGEKNLNVESLHPQSYVYRQILNTISAKRDHTPQAMIRALEEEANRHPGENIYKLFLKRFKTLSEQHKNQFFVSMKKQRTDYVQVLLDLDNPNKSTAVNANNRKIGTVVQKRWSDDISTEMQSVANHFSGDVDSLVRHINVIGDTFLFNMEEHVLDLKNKQIDDIKFEKRLLDEIDTTLLYPLGIQVDPKTLTALLSKDSKELFSRKNGFTLRSNTFASSYRKDGMFGSIADILSRFNVRKLSGEDYNTDVVISNLLEAINQTGIRTFANIEGMYNNGYFQSSYSGVKSKGSSSMRYSLRQPTPNENMVDKLFSDLPYRDAIANSVGNRKLFLFNGNNFGGVRNEFNDQNEKVDSTFEEIFKYRQNDSNKIAGTDEGLNRNDLGPADLVANALINFQSGGARVMSIVDTTKSDKKFSPLITIPRTDLDVAIREGDEIVGSKDILNFIDGKLVINSNTKRIIMNSVMMDNAMSVVEAELDRMLFVLTSKDGSTHADKIKELKRIFGDNYIFNAQFFYSDASLNNLIERNADGSIKQDKENIAKLYDKKLFREALYEKFIARIDKDIKSWERLGLVVKGKKKYFTKILSKEWAISKGYLPFIHDKKKEDATRSNSYEDYEAQLIAAEEAMEAEMEAAMAEEEAMMDIDNEDALTESSEPKIPINIKENILSPYLASYLAANSTDVDVEDINNMSAYELDEFVSIVGDNIIKSSNGVVPHQLTLINNAVSNELKIAQYNDETLRALAVLSIESNINSFAVMGAMGIAISGDPAILQKSLSKIIDEKKKIVKQVEINDEGNSLAIHLAIDTFMNEYQKRSSSDIAPSKNALPDYEIVATSLVRDENGDPKRDENNELIRDVKYVSGNKKYRVSFIDDIITDGAKYLDSVNIPKEMFENPKIRTEFIKSYSGEGTDGLEIVSFYNKLDSLYRCDGKIDAKDYNYILETYNKTQKIHPRFANLFKIGAGKPVQVDHVIKTIGDETIVTKIFIKSSEICLTADFTKSLNGELDNIRKAMEHGWNIDPDKDQHIGRLVHKSATKLGAQKTKNIHSLTKNRELNKTIVEYIHDEMMTSSEEMSWDSFGYQQETPTHFGEPTITNVRQADKSILGGLYDSKFNFKGEEIAGKDLDKIKHNINIELSRIEKERVEEKLFVNGKINAAKLAKSAIKSSSGVSSNEANSIVSVDKAGLPLMWSYGRKVVEEFINSVYSDVIRLQRPGRANPQFPHIGGGYLVGNNTIVDKDGNKAKVDLTGIIHLNNRNGYTGPPRYTTVETLEDGKKVLVHTAEIYVSLDMIANGKPLRPEDIDFNNISEELLTIVGMRLPNQLHQSQVVFKIIGFIPQSVGTMCIVPQEIVVQTGSDFDIDKLFQYWKNAFRTKENKLISTPKDAITYGDNGEIIRNDVVIKKFIEDNFVEADKITEDDVYNRSLENDYMDIFISVLTNPNVASESLKKLDADDLKSSGEKYFVLKPKEPWYSYQRQNEEYRLQQSAKNGINLFAKGMSSIILTDGKEMMFDTMSVDKLSINEESLPLILKYISPYGRSIINGEDRTAVKNVVILLSEAIDNAKNGNLIPNGLNDETFALAFTLQVLSDVDGNALSLELIPALMNQEVTSRASYIAGSSKGLVVRAPKSISIIDAMPQAIAEMANELGVPYSSVKYRYERIKGTSKYSSQSLYNLYTQGQSIFSDKSVSDEDKILYLAKQMDLYKNVFTKLTDMSKNITKMIMDTKFDGGFDSSSASNDLNVRRIIEDKLKYDSDPFSRVIKNRDKYKEHVDGGLNTTGNNIAIAVDVVTKVKEAMGYDDPILSSIISRIVDSKYMGVDEYVTMVSTIVDNYKSYIFNKTIRNEFLEDRNKDISIYDLGKNIVGSIRMLRKTPKYYNNKFLKAITVNQSGNTISFNADLINNADLEACMEGLKDMFGNKDPEAKALITNIFYYEFLTNGNKTGSSFSKIFPTDILNDFKFFDAVKRTVDSMTDGNYVSEFVNLFYRNNPRFIKSFSELSGIRNNGVDITKSFKALPNNKIPNSNIHYVYIGDGINTNNAPLFIKDFSRADKGKIYAWNGVSRKSGKYYFSYEMFDQSQDDGVILKGSAYMFSRKGKWIPKAYLNTSFFTDYSSDEQSKSFYISDDSKISSTSNGNFDMEKTYFIRGLDSTSSIRELIPDVENIGSTFSNWISGISKIMPERFMKIGVRVVNSKSKDVSPNYVYGDVSEYRSVKGKGEIIIYRDALSRLIDETKSIDFARETLLHEVQHALMIESYELGRTGDEKFKQISKDIDYLFSESMKSLSALPVIDAITGNSFDNITYGQLLKDGKISYTLSNGEVTNNLTLIANELFENEKDINSFKRSMYMFTSPMEFMAEISSRKYVQELMDTTMLSGEAYKKLKIKENRSILESIITKFAEFFRSLKSFFNGNDVDSVSILEASMIQNMKVAATHSGVESIRQMAVKSASERSTYHDPSRINLEDALATFNFGLAEGKKQSESMVRSINKIIVNSPDEPIMGGESFNSFSKRILGVAKNAILLEPNNTTIITHNTAFGLIKLWDEKGRPDILTKAFREEYTTRDSETGDSYSVKSRRGHVNIVRHGETDDNVSHRFRSKNAMLTDNGIQQALNLKPKLGAIPKIITSSLPRAIDTANIIMRDAPVSSKYTLGASDSQQLSGTVRDFLANATKQQRESFRFALNNNIFKTKC